MNDTRLWTKLLLLGSSILLFMILLEAALRMGVLRNDFRDHIRTIVGQSERGKRTILVLGDSCAQLVFKWLSRRLASSDATLVKGTWSGSGPLTYDLEMRSAARLFRPDAVILFYSASSDLTDVQYQNWAVRLLTPLFYDSYLCLLYTSPSPRDS